MWTLQILPHTTVLESM
nr:immunoglobulin heavy chain junction region [Mus musculus]